MEQVKDDHHQPIDSPVQRDPRRRVSRSSGGWDRSIEKSPLHRQARSSLEKKSSSETGQGGVAAPNTPGRFKPSAGILGDESPDKGQAVPKFGAWDEGDPSSADGFTGIFDKVREEKQAGSAKVPYITDDSVYINGYSHGGSGQKSSGCWCFSWGKK